MSFLSFDDLYTKTALVLGVSATKFTADDGKVFDSSKVTLFSELSGDLAVGGTGTQMVWGTSANCAELKAAGKQFPAQVELKIRKAAKSLGKELEEIVEFKYISAVKVVPLDLKKAA